MRLIDADALKESLIETLHRCDEWIENAKDEETRTIAESNYTAFLESILRVKEAPTIDAVPADVAPVMHEEDGTLWVTVGDCETVGRVIVKNKQEHFCRVFYMGDGDEDAGDAGTGGERWRGMEELLMEKNEIIARLERIARRATHTVGEPPFIMSLDDGIAVHEAIEIIQRSQLAGRWIPCEEMLPKNKSEVLVTDMNGHIRHALYNAVWDRFGTYEESMTVRAIAWMPLPEPYMGERKDDNSL